VEGGLEEDAARKAHAYERVRVLAHRLQLLELAHRGGLHRRLGRLPRREHHRA